MARPLYVRLKAHIIDTANIMEEQACTRNLRKESTDTDYKSALAEHVATSNHVIDWDSIKVLEQEQTELETAVHQGGHPHPCQHTFPQQAMGDRCASRRLGLPSEPTTSAETTAPLTSP